MYIVKISIHNNNKILCLNTLHVCRSMLKSTKDLNFFRLCIYMYINTL